MGERGDIIRTMQREFSEKGLTRAAGDYVIYDPTVLEARPITGRMVARGLADELNDRQYLIVDGVDGRSHYVDIGKGEATEPTPQGAVIHIEREMPKPALSIALSPKSQRRMAGATMSISISGTIRPPAPPFPRPFATSGSDPECHQGRRAGAGGDVDHRARSCETGGGLRAPAGRGRAGRGADAIRLTDRAAAWRGRCRLARPGATVVARDSGFGRDVRDARRQWLIKQELARTEQDQTIYRANMLGILRRRELSRVAGQLSDELGLDYAEIRPSE
jgi:Protein of unknown function (DUF3363)